MQKGSAFLLLLAIIVVLILGTFMFFYVYNQIKSESSDAEIKNKEAVKKESEQNFFSNEFSQKGMKDIKLYFPKKEFNNCTRDINKDHFDYVTRTVKDTQNIAYVSLEELLKGLSEEDKSKGHWNDIPDGVKIKSVGLTDGRADVDLNEKIKDNPSSCGAKMRYWQMKLTLTQFPNITAAAFTINSDPKTYFQP